MCINMWPLTILNQNQDYKKVYLWLLNKRFGYLYFHLTSFLIWISYGVRRHNHAHWLFLQSRINRRLFIWQAKIKCGFSQRINKILLVIMFSLKQNYLTSFARSKNWKLPHVCRGSKWSWSNEFAPCKIKIRILSLNRTDFRPKKKNNNT